MDTLTLKQLIDYIECLPKDDEELLAMEVKVRIPHASGQYNQVIGIKHVSIEKILHKENEAIIIETGYTA